jgi:3-hydroxyacyl-CoA dehydrogenase/enoyl-CoA hydratase/3-hydroxybutyryl-CoA epimerase
MSYLQIEKDKESGVAVVWLDQPDSKVNKLSVDASDEFVNVFNTLEKDGEVRGIVVISKKPDTFIAGADLDKFLGLQHVAEVEKMIRAAQVLFTRIATFTKPVVAAIHGAALGGGLEFALACTYRIASDDPKTVLGQPEVRLGVIPAVGGNQRLPRLIGLQKALDLILTGKRVYAKKAYKIGLVDDLIHRHGLLAAAKTAALYLAKNKVRRRDRRTLWEKLLELTPIGRNLIYKLARARVEKETGGHYPAPLKTLECVQRGREHGMEEGFVADARAFGEVVCGDVAQELVRIFFNMNRHQKNQSTELAKSLNHIGILGSGLMGTGIASVTSGSGFWVMLKDVNTQSLEMAEKTLYNELNDKVSKGVVSGFQRDRQLGHVFTQSDYHGFDKAGVVIEAVFEDVELKRKVLAETEAVIRDDCVFASNTSCLAIGDIAKNAKHPERVLGMHYFSPVQQMPLLEIIVTPQTAPWALATAYELGLSQGKTMIVVNDGPGFYTTRILTAYVHEAMSMLEAGGDILATDRALKAFGFPIGPLKLLDEVGFDVAAHIDKAMAEFLAKRGSKAIQGVDKLLQAGYKGRKNKKGFYRYDGRGKHQQVNPAILNFLPPGGETMSAADIQERLVLAMVNEAAYALGDGIIKTPEDGDVGAVFGLGFPPYLGGTFRYADKLGIAALVASLQKLQKKYGNQFAPAPVLQEMVSKNRKFY